MPSLLPFLLMVSLVRFACLAWRHPPPQRLFDECLKALVAEGFLEQHGKGKGTTTQLNDDGRRNVVVIFVASMSCFHIK